MNPIPPTYRAVLVGLTGIGAARPAEAEGLPLSGSVPASHAAAYHRHPRTELVGVCDLKPELLDAFRTRWSRRSGRRSSRRSRPGSCSTWPSHRTPTFGVTSP